MTTARQLQRTEIPAIWAIDRSEVIRGFYHLAEGELAYTAEHFEATGWPPGEAALYTPLLEACFDHGGWFWGIFAGARLVAIAVLEARFIGDPPDQLQLAFLHVDRAFRGQGLGRQLFAQASAEAARRGAKRLYISATPTDHTIQFYLSLGCTLAARPDPQLYAREPDDIHLEYAISDL